MIGWFLMRSETYESISGSAFSTPHNIDVFYSPDVRHLFRSSIPTPAFNSDSGGGSGSGERGIRRSGLVVPEYRGIGDKWKEKPIEECGERLVDFFEIYGGKGLPIAVDMYIDLPEYADLYESRVLVREGVAHALAAAGKGLKEIDPYLEYVVRCAHRSLPLQALEHKHYGGIIRELNPRGEGEDEATYNERLRLLIEEFSAAPSLNPPSHHNTGGGLDLCLRDKRTGEYVIMGSPYAVPAGLITRPSYFQGLQDDYSHMIQKNRDIFQQPLLRVGFTFNENEWWHVDKGNQMNALMLGLPHAIYGAISLPSE
jgi:D-alanyl-D-alanine dipeptidase